MNAFRKYVARPLAEKCFRERRPALYTEEPLPADYEALRSAIRRAQGRREPNASGKEIFEEEWRDVYRSYQ